MAVVLGPMTELTQDIGSGVLCLNGDGNGNACAD